MTKPDRQSEVFHRVRPALGTLVGFELGAASSKAAQIALESAFAAIVRVSFLMHPTDPGSDLERIGTAAPNAPIAVDPWTYEVLGLSRELNSLTSGLFDPCLASRPGRMSDIELGTTNHVACRMPVALDLGGIAKGFAVDRAVEALQAHGCHAGLVNAGGDLRVFGPIARKVEVRLPDGTVAQVELANAALAVSAPRSVASPSGHRGYYRGTTGEVMEGRTAVVTAAEAAIADALTKCVMLCPAAASDAILGRYGARVLALDTRG